MITFFVLAFIHMHGKVWHFFPVMWVLHMRHLFSYTFVRYMRYRLELLMMWFVPVICSSKNRW